MVKLDDPIWGPPALSAVFGHLSRPGLCSWQHKPHPDLQYFETGFGVEFCKYIFFWKSLEIPHTGSSPFVKMLIHRGTQLDWVVVFSSTQVHWLMCLVTLTYYWPIESNLPAAGLRDPSRTVAPKLSCTPASLRGLVRVHDFWASPQIQWSESLGEHTHGWIPPSGSSTFLGRHSSAWLMETAQYFCLMKLVSFHTFLGLHILVWSVDFVQWFTG